ncbi:LOW QUALITY PROTEIN: cilia and flagella-associated protein 47-like [Diorhabda carinulata]|uniref:LOW QUALITY PROTEIN: cilia and flagella-associated protein 47-like n=1 Tax=Diorhabda carinulata TaxID=1163345 RepID=UPI0025A19D4B|nr:LOW QUALITY PROTEIN: cilia and flagella-associated protein 47-like [Diorhabda carinulata]
MSDNKDWIVASLTRHTSISNGVSEYQESIILKDFIELEQVRIYPGRLAFNGAYDGKKFLEKFRIINLGKVPAFVRVMQPTSKAFRMKPLSKGCILSSGLSITRYIRYTYFSATALPQVHVTVYINEKPILYELVVNLSQALVKTTPKILYFGDINVGTSSDQLSLTLHNEGQKITHFSVDLGRNDLELIVDPMKGSIKPDESIIIKVEILGSREGQFLKEFWIKTEPPQRILLTGTFITPKLTIEHPPNSFDLIIIDFPKTYYNADSIRALIIKNNSSTSTMFCTMANCNNEEKTLEEAKKIDNNLKFFLFNPKEGRLTKNHKAIIIITFAPRRLRAFTQKYCIAMIKIIKVNFRDGVIKGKDIEVKTFSSNSEVDQFQIGSVASIDNQFSEIEFTSNYLRICLYGEIEEPNVRLTPHSIDRDDLYVGTLYRFTFNIKNCSKYLPITFKYEKLACFQIVPPEMTLKPNCSVDVWLLLKPSTIGQIDTNINLRLTYKAYGIVYKVGTAHFHARYICHKHPGIVSPMIKPQFNMGITPIITHEVGFLVDDIRFNQAKTAPIVPFVDNANRMSFDKRNTDLIAFPNDRPRSLRPWTSKVPCKTIFKNIPRFNSAKDDYTLSPAEIEKKRKNDQIYLNLLNKNRKPVVNIESERNAFSFYPTSMAKILMTNEPVRDCPYVFKTTQEKPGLIPLTPEQLIAVKISPHYIQLGKIAPYISCSDFFTIENKNEFPILITIVALSNSVIVKGKKKTTIGAFAISKLYFDCFSHGLGKYYVPVYIIINNCHIFDATVFAEVAPSTVKCKTKEITTNPKDDVAYLELYNPVNCAIDFSLVLLDQNFSIRPCSGTIESRRSLFCKIVFSPRIDAVFKTDIFLYSQSGAKQVIGLSTENSNASVLFNTHSVEFNDIPLNMTVSEYLVFKNNSRSTIVLYVKNEHPMAEITVSPKEAIVPGKSVIFFKIYAHFRTVETFKCECVFVVQDRFNHKIEIVGTVNYPTFSIEPNYIQIRKIVTGACQRKVFKIKSTNSAKLSIRFALDLYLDYKILDMDKRVVEEINLNPHETITLYMEFQPPEPTAYTFFLPMIINDLVGPPTLNDPKSFEYTTYFDRLPIENGDSPKIIGLRVSCAAGTPWFQFSSLYLNFDKDLLKKTIRIKNISTVTKDIKLLIDNLGDYFKVELQDCSGIYKIKEKYIKVTLESDQEVVFAFSFDGDCYGVYRTDIPIFVNDYFENCPFNYVRLYAEISKPTIQCKIRMVCLPTIPIKATCMSLVPFTIHSHREGCRINVVVEHNYLKAKLVKNVQGSNQDIKVTFLPKTQCDVITKMTISCSCEAFCEISVVASANNCSLLSFRHRMKWYPDIKEQTVDDYNYDMNNVDFRQKLDKLKIILEKYTYTQGFFSSLFYRIPETISKYPFEVYRKSQNKRIGGKNKKKHLPIVTLLKNMTDGRIIKHLVDGIHSAVLDDIEGTLYDYTTYKNVLLYMEEYGMFTKNIRPEYLLTYKRYLIFKEQFVDNENIIDDVVLSEVDYNFLSKQSWLDLLIRIYKMLTYDRLLSDNYCTAGKLIVQDPFQEQSREYYLAKKDNFSSDIDEGEIKLMLWLEYHFNLKKDKLWPGKEVPSRVIRDLCYDIRDSLPLITLTATYCPYLEEYFRETYFEPFTDPGQLLHNACLVSEAWNKLELSYTISTDNIVEPTNTEMIIFLSYLYSVLPYFYPKETVTINSDLGQTSSVHVFLTNDGNVTSNYKAILFSNDNDSFSLEPSEITLSPTEKKDIRVFYKAKQIMSQEAVLVLSGESGGSEKYSKSSAINLIGIPDILYFVEEFSLAVNMYEYTVKNIPIQSDKQTLRTMLFGYHFFLFMRRDQSYIDNERHYIRQFGSHLPRQLRIDGICNFNENGVHKLNISLCFITCGKSIYYIYFHNKEVGDFCMKLNIDSKLPEGAFEEVRIRIPSNFDTFSICKCKSGINPLCQRSFKAAIPFRNSHLLIGLRNMIKIHADNDEKEFWNTHLVFPKGFHIFREYVTNMFEPALVPFKKVLDSEVTYIPKVEGGSYSTEGSVIMKDITDEGTFQLLLHWDASSFPENETLVLRADHKLEIRKFHLTFWTREPRNIT